MNHFTDPAAPIASLQRMLNAVSPKDVSPLNTNGNFDEATLESVMRFQQGQGLPVTGTVDKETWDSLLKKYIQILQPHEPPQPISLFSSIIGWSVSPGEFSLLLFPIQGMFSALGERIGGIQAVSPSGWLDQETASNLRMIQACGQCEVCGSLNRSTWNILRRTYETFVVRALELPPDLLDS